jgi:hypothetical protein
VTGENCWFAQKPSEERTKQKYDKLRTLAGNLFVKSLEGSANSCRSDCFSFVRYRCGLFSLAVLGALFTRCAGRSFHSRCVAAAVGGSAAKSHSKPKGGGII